MKKALSRKIRLRLRDMETEDHLEKKAFEVLQLCLTAMVEHLELHKPSHEDLISDPAILSCWPNKRAYDLANSVLEIIQPSPIGNPGDLFRIVTDEFVAELNENPGELSPDRVMKKIMKRLHNPLKNFRFSVLISAGSGIALEVEIGGSHKLKLKMSSKLGTLPRTELSGTVSAIDEFSAISFIEDYIRILLGTALALGIAEPLPSIVYSIPKISLAGEIEIEAPLSASVGGLSSRIRFGVPNDLDELESKMIASGNLDTALGRRLRALTSVLTIESERGIELQNASKLLFDAFAAAPSGMAVAVAFMSMEAVLLDRNVTSSTTARLSEAVAYRLGNSAVERKQLRRQVSKLYEQRSSFVHTGCLPNGSTAFHDALTLASRVLQREILDLEPVTR